MWQHGWWGVGRGYMFMCGWVPLLFTWKYHNIVNQLYQVQNKKYKRKKKYLKGFSDQHSNSRTVVVWLKTSHFFRASKAFGQTNLLQKCTNAYTPMYAAGISVMAGARKFLFLGILSIPLGLFLNYSIPVACWLCCTKAPDQNPTRDWPLQEKRGSCDGWAPLRSSSKLFWASTVWPNA